MLFKSLDYIIISNNKYILVSYCVRNKAYQI